MEDLWSRWAHHYDSLGLDSNEICRDGILNPQKWEEASRKVLFVMKEVNDYGGGNLRELLKGGPKYQLWHATARWAKGLLEDFPPFEEVDTYSAMTEALHQVASINLKKYAGSSSANMTEVNAFTHRDQDLLLDQIDRIGPDVVVACATMDPLIWLLDLDVEPREFGSEPIHDSDRDMTVLPWVHPSRVNNRKTYSGLRELWAKA